MLILYNNGNLEYTYIHDDLFALHLVNFLQRIFFRWTVEMYDIVDRPYNIALFLYRTRLHYKIVCVKNIFIVSLVEVFLCGCARARGGGDKSDGAVCRFIPRTRSFVGARPRLRDDSAKRRSPTSLIERKQTVRGDSRFTRILVIIRYRC